MSEAKTYHHGDLQRVLLDAAQALLASEGGDALSLRKLAQRVGVSRSAPYHHFEDKHSLLCALAARGFQELEQLMPEPGPDQDLATVLRQFVSDYLRFAISQPERYELMFGRQLWKVAGPTPELKTVAYATFRRYAKAVELIVNGGTKTSSKRRGLRLAQASWATLHGLCSLLNDGIYVDAADMEEVSGLAVELMLTALVAEN